MKITAGKFEIAETAGLNTLNVFLEDGAEVNLVGKMTLTMVREALKNSGSYTDEADMFADADWCKSILNKEKALTIANNNEVPPLG
jgi:hypothetical protein